MYLRAPINKQIYPSTQVKIENGKAIINVEISEKYHHTAGAMHGSVYFKLLDDAAFFAANSVVADVFVLTSSFHLNFLKPVVAGKITSIGTLTFQSKNTFVAESKLYNKQDQLVGFGTGNFARSKMPLNPKIGYY